jgi:hypothetical protein
MSKTILHKDAVLIRTAPVNLEMFVVINHKGQYCRNRDYNDTSWTDDIKKAKIYTKIGPARSTITWYSSNIPDMPMPMLGVLPIRECRIVDESVRVESAKITKERRELEYQIKRAQRDLEKAQSNLGTAHSNAISSAKKAQDRLADLALKMEALKRK